MHSYRRLVSILTDHKKDWGHHRSRLLGEMRLNMKHSIMRATSKCRTVTVVQSCIHVLYMWANSANEWKRV